MQTALTVDTGPPLRSLLPSSSESRPSSGNPASTVSRSQPREGSLRMSKATSETLLIGRHELPGTADADQFVGAQHGGVPVSFFLVHSASRRPGRTTQPPLSRGVRAPRRPGNVRGRRDRDHGRGGRHRDRPCRCAASFANTGPEELRLTAIHPAAEMSTEWLTSRAAKGHTSLPPAPMTNHRRRWIQ